jgi:hypothetical protein
MITNASIDRLYQGYKEWFAREYYVDSGNLVHYVASEDEKADQSYYDAMGRYEVAVALGG